MISGVEQKPDALGFDVNAVAVASGLQCDDFHGGIVPRMRWVRVAQIRTRVRIWPGMLLWQGHGYQEAAERW